MFSIVCHENSHSAAEGLTSHSYLYDTGINIKKIDGIVSILVLI